MHVCIHDPIFMILYIFCTHYSVYKIQYVFAKSWMRMIYRRSDKTGCFLVPFSTVRVTHHVAHHPGSFLLYVHTQGLLGTWSPGQPPRLSQNSWALMILHLMLLYIHRDCTSTETVHPQRQYIHRECIRDVQPRTATSTFTQLLNSDDSLFNVALHAQRLYIHRDCTSTETVHPQRLYIHRDCTSTETVLGMCSPGCPPRLSHSSWAPLPVHRLFI